ncbi:DUF2752 domain-containing protein [Nocardia sp. BMG111209]|uniref:DUF2752 domain-containing protein n=1 Tax=Nocardia sp. BMG111209 TaxID=1160137 RepID=UPI00036C583B|nr:DUF2752 domain-containing protein [Nocardia sp. BMG111209]
MDTAAAPPAETRTGWVTLGQPALIAGGLAAAVAVLHFRDPHVSGSYGYCPFYALTGYWCPGCGGLRAMHNLSEGHVLDAIHSNILLLPLTVAFVVWWVHLVVNRWNGRRRPFPFHAGPITLAVSLALLAVFSVLRNTPWGSWLAPV